MQKRIRAAIFDLDGTTAYTVGDLLKSMNIMLSHFGYLELTKEQIFGHISFGERVAVGVTWGYREEKILRKNGADIIVHSPEELLAICGLDKE